MTHSFITAMTVILCSAFAASCGGNTNGQPDAQAAALEARADRIQDANDIRRLQRAYGFYWDKGRWDDVADLFAADATIEYGSEGVYVGQKRIREYLLRLGHDRIGLVDGELNNRMILQPVVHVAPDGLTAKARWRSLIQSGKFRQSAAWGEGTYEVEYVKQDDVWKIAKLHWYIGFVAPFEGGWAKMQPMEAWVSPVSATLPPDRPPTEDYKPWPAAFTPPFHYPNPASQPAPSAPTGLDPSLAAWEREVARLEAHEAVKNLQASYGYYLDKQLWDDAARLFTDDATYEVAQRGVYKGPTRIRAALGLNGPQGPQPGVLNNEMQLQPVIHVSADGRSAQARWRTLEMKGVHGQSGQWGEGVYENEYRLDGGVWKISRLHYYLTFRGDYDKGWSEAPLPIDTVSETLPPDAPPTEVYGALPEVYLPPYHYTHPVRQPQPRPDIGEVPAALAPLAKKLSLLNDEIEVRNLQRSYGYYVDKHLWDEVADLFADEATLEIGGRGVFVGRERVRQYMHFLGDPGPQRGWLYDHSQWQSIVHVAEDGLSARARLRAFIMGGAPPRPKTNSDEYVFGETSVFGEATYENEYVRQNGVWKISKLYGFFNFYSPLSEGWAKAAMPNTGPEAKLPPDRPPTVVYQTYPTAAMVPYHYSNPVSGR